MSEFHDDYPQYELMAHHSEEEGVKKRKKLWNVFWIMLTITIIELIIGSKAASMGLLDDVTRTSGITLKFIFIGLTILKAFYIVFSFMHLGEERKFLKFAIVGPYMIFILYLIWMCVTEANYARIHKNDMDSIIVQQKIELNKAATSGHHEGAASEETAKPAEGANP